MALVSCPSCGKKVSDRAPACSFCGLALHGEAPAAAAVPGVVQPPPGPPPLPPPVSMAPARPAPKSSRRVLVIVAAVGLGLVLACGGLSTLVYFLYIRETVEPVTAADAEMLITAERLAEWARSLEVEPARGQWRKVRFMDGSRELSYEYESADGTVPLYVKSSLSYEPRLSDAVTVYTAEAKAIGLVMGFVGRDQNLRTVERNDLLRWGDQSSCQLILKGDKPVGNVFAARKDRRILLVMFVGVYFDEGQALRDALGPMLERAASFGPA